MHFTLSFKVLNSELKFTFINLKKLILFYIIYAYFKYDVLFNKCYDGKLACISNDSCFGC